MIFGPKEVCLLRVRALFRAVVLSFFGSNNMIFKGKIILFPFSFYSYFWFLTNGLLLISFVVRFYNFRVSIFIFKLNRFVTAY
jgi:hypothetical protein